MDEPKLDLKTINQYKGMKTRDGQELLDLLVETYQGEFPQHMKQLRFYCAQENYQELASLAHKLKSSSGNIGFVEVFNRLAEIEQFIRSKEKVSQREIESRLEEIGKQINIHMKMLFDYIKKEGL